MPRRYVFGFLILTLILLGLACNAPTTTDRALQTATALALTPAGSVTPSAGTLTPPAVVTATPAPGSTTAPGTTQAAACTYKVSFITDVTVPDDTIVSPGKTFVKTWRVRNDGTCTWGAGHPLGALAFTGGSRLGAPATIPLSATINPGDTADVSVSLTAPTADGTYISQWEFLVQNDPSGAGPYIGVGADSNGPLYARIKVGAGNQASVIRLSFDPGATNTYVSGDLQPNEVRQYVLAAQKGQIIQAYLSPSANGAKLTITAGDQTPLTGSTGPDGLFAMAALPSTQDYIVTVTNGPAKVNFSLSISIPSRITFAPGGTEASVNGTVSHHFNVSYVLRAQQGQTMTVALTGNNVGLTIYGLQDGQPLIRAVSGATSFNRQLPATQDYIIDVVPAVDSTTFSMKITVK